MKGLLFFVASPVHSPKDLAEKRLDTERCKKKNQIDLMHFTHFIFSFVQVR